MSPGTGDRAGRERPRELPDDRQQPPRPGRRGRDQADPPAGAATVRPVAEDDALRVRQEAGLQALIGIATYSWVGMAEASTTVIPRLPPEPGVPAAGPAAGPGGRFGSPLIWLRADHLVRNSLYLMLSTGIQATLGFAFWIVMARVYSAADVGRASSLISATVLIAYFALFGLNTTLVRYLPTATDSRALITAASVLVAGSGAVIGLAYVLLTPVIAPRLAFIDRPALAAGFVLLAAAAAVNLLMDSVFIASRRAGLCTLTDGAIGGVSKIGFGIVLAGSGAYGLYSASVGGFAMSALASLVLIVVVLHWRPSLRQPFTALKPLLRFSGGNYAANALNLLPSVVVPIVVLDRLGPQAAAYYFVAFQMASLLYGAIYAVEQAFLAEGSQAAADWRAIRRRSRRLAVMLFVPGGIVLAAASHWVLLAFGSGYSRHGTVSLELLAAAVIPMAACNWSWAVLRLSGKLTGLVVSTAVYSVGICTAAWILSAHGLTALSSCWFIGSTIGAVVAGVAAAAASKAPARHRRAAAGSAPVRAP